MLLPVSKRSRCSIEFNFKKFFVHNTHYMCDARCLLCPYAGGSKCSERFYVGSSHNIFWYAILECETLQSINQLSINQIAEEKKNVQKKKIKRIFELMKKKKKRKTSIFF